jgi:hypothetical protein
MIAWRRRVDLHRPAVTSGFVAATNVGLISPVALHRHGRLWLDAVDVAQSSLKRIERRPTIGMSGRAGTKRPADPFLTGARNNRDLFRSGATFFLAQLGKKNVFELRDGNDLSDQDDNSL